MVDVTKLQKERERYKRFVETPIGNLFQRFESAVISAEKADAEYERDDTPKKYKAAWNALNERSKLRKEFLDELYRLAGV